MIGLVLDTHDHLADSFVAAAEHVVGAQTSVGTVCIGEDDDTEGCRNDILDAVAAADDGNGVIVLTDMFGGTPSNLAISVMDRPGVEVIAGLNLPMLIKLLKVRDCNDLGEAAVAGKEAGRKYIKVASEFLTAKAS